MVESFEVDHTTLNAPLIRLAKVIERDGHVIMKFDLRFVKPNTGLLPTPAIHSIEHLMAVATREVFEEDDVIDFSPMGCRTGFYFTLFATNEDQAREKIIESLKLAKESPLLAVSERECGSYRHHDEQLAKKLIEEFLFKLIAE